MNRLISSTYSPPKILLRGFDVAKGWSAGELLRVCAGHRIVAFEDGFCGAPDRYIQRIVAVNTGKLADVTATPRFRLDQPAD